MHVWLGVVLCTSWTRDRAAESVSERKKGLLSAPSPLRSIKNTRSKQCNEYTQVTLQTLLTRWNMLLGRSGLFVLRLNGPMFSFTMTMCMIILVLLIVLRIAFFFVLHSAAVESNVTASPRQNNTNKSRRRQRYFLSPEQSILLLEDRQIMSGNRHCCSYCY